MAAPLLVWGCSSPAPAAKAGEKEPEKPAPRRAIDTGPVTIEGQLPNGEKSYALKSPGATFDIEGDNRIQSGLKNVEVTIFEANQPASVIKADSATIDKTNQKLVLVGKVVVTSQRDQATLRANQIVYRETMARVEATGQVRLEQKGWSMGPLPELWANRDLSRVATPKAWKEKE